MNSSLAATAKRGGMRALSNTATAFITSSRRCWQSFAASMPTSNNNNNNLRNHFSVIATSTRSFGHSFDNINTSLVCSSNINSATSAAPPAVSRMISKVSFNNNSKFYGTFAQRPKNTTYKKNIFLKEATTTTTTEQQTTTSNNGAVLELINDTNLRVAIVGRPNVGKSTLFNKLIGRAHAIADSLPGVTRDCQEDVANLMGIKFTIIDTPGADNVEKILAQTHDAVRTADLILLVTDAKEGLTELDKRIAKWVAAKNMPTVHILNKCDNLARDEGEESPAEAQALYFGVPIEISAERGFGLDEIFNVVYPLYLRHNAQKEMREARLRGEQDEGGETEKIALNQVDDMNEDIMRLALIGRTNVGKSTIVNRLIGRERVVVSSEAGTTRDTIELRCMYGDQKILLADTAGVRKKKWLTERVDHLSQEDTLRTIRFANVCALVIDSQEPLTRDDLRIADMVSKEGRAVVIAANKWDLIDSPYVVADRIEHRVANSLSQLKGVPVVVCSALREGKNLRMLMDKCVEAYKRWNTRIPTPKLNQFLQKLILSMQLPAKYPRIQYMTQIGIRPPTFAIFFTRTEELPQQYQRKIINSIREEFNLDGVPIRLIQRRWNRDKRPGTGKVKSLPGKTIKKNTATKKKQKLAAAATSSDNE